MICMFQFRNVFADLLAHTDNTPRGCPPPVYDMDHYIFWFLLRENNAVFHFIYKISQKIQLEKTKLQRTVSRDLRLRF